MTGSSHPRENPPPFRGSKHTSLVPSLNESREVRLTLTAYKLRNFCHNFERTAML